MTLKELFLKVLRMDKNRCQHCGHHTEYPPHHIKYRSQGGIDDPANIITLCEDCHTKAHHGGFYENERVSAHEFVRRVLKKLENKAEFRLIDAYNYLKSLPDRTVKHV